MSFTPDEIQAFSSILEQKLTQHRREMERIFEQRLLSLKRDIEQRLGSIERDMQRTLTQGFGEQNRKLRGMLGELVLSAETNSDEAVGTEYIQDETEIDWEDLSAIIGQVLDDRFRVLQDVSKSVEQLEHIIEAMQVAMTTNTALLSNRLYHHQQLPLERAHSSQETPASQDTLPLKRIQIEP